MVKLNKHVLVSILVFTLLFSILVVANGEIYVWERKTLVETRVEGNVTYETVKYEILPRVRNEAVGIGIFLTATCLLLALLGGLFIKAIVEG